MLDQLRDWSWVAIIGFILLYPSFSDAASNENLREPIQIRVQDCQIYAHDAFVARQLRENGKTKAQVIERWKQSRENFTPKQWPHALALIESAFTTELSPQEFWSFIYEDCVKNDGWLGRES